MTDPVIIIGGGISGLVCAYRLEQAGAEYLLLEASDRLGGNIHTVRRQGYLYDVGPDAFLRAKAAGEKLCVELGLGDDLIVPQADGTRVFIAFDGALQPMPEGLSLGVPKRPWPILSTPLLSPLGKCRALLEPWVRARRDDKEESIAQFLTRRLGSEMAERIAAPLLSGVFAGDAQQLSMDAAFAPLLNYETTHGSLFAGMNGGKSPWKVMLEPVVQAKSPFVSLRAGLGSLIDALAAQVGPEKCHLRERALSIQKSGGGYVVSTDAGSYQARAVVIAGPPWMAEDLLSSIDAQAQAALGQIRGFSTATVYFALEREQVQHDLGGSGFIVPPGEGEILAATFVSSKWPERAPRGRALVRAFVGGARLDITGISDAALTELAHRELTRFLGSLGPVEFSAVHRYERGSPQPELGHRERLEQITSALSACPHLSLIGAGYGSVGIPDCIAQANQVTAELI